LLLPMTVVGALSLRTAARIKAENPVDDALYRRLMTHRMITQGIGMVSILVTSLWGMWQNLSLGAL
ncbi:MAG: component of SufBCD complex, partial [Paracoccaceae bacterium]|nr:component of SufBCD complex [Paracoccaceae bacterium]